MNLKTLSQLSDQEFEEQFAGLTLRPSLFSHEAHIRLAYIHIKKYGLKNAEKNLFDQINRFATHHGEANKFNTTVTIAAVKAVYHFMQKSTSDNFDDLIQEFPRLITNFRDLIETHYGFNVFADKRAKQEFMEPDLVGFG